MNNLIEFYNANSNIKWVFFDMFDTIVHRKCEPEYIKKIWAKRLMYAFSIKLDSIGIYKVRRASEDYLRYLYKNTSYEYNYLELCSEIYFRLSNSAFLDKNETSYDEFFKFSIRLERNLEITYQYVDNESVEAIKYIKNKNVKIGIISDFYHDKDFILQCLKNIDTKLCFDEIFVSCEYRASKSIGDIYPIVINKLEISPCDAIMIGDNKCSDYTMPLKYGIKSYFKKHNYQNNSKNKLLIHAINKLSNDKQFKKYPYSNYAFSFFLFTDRLYKKLKENRVKNIFFLSREGEELKKYFDYYCNLIGDTTINTQYLYVSRVSTFIPSLKELQDEDFGTLFRDYKNISALSFLKNFQVPDVLIENICVQIGLDKNEIIIEFKSSIWLKKIIENDIFKNHYVTLRTTQKINFKGYLDSFNIDFEKEGISIVDIGWKGTIQDNIYNFFEGNVKIKGFYFGLKNIGNLSLNNEKTGIIFSAFPYKSRYYNVYSIDYSFYERLLFASHGSVQSYEIDQYKRYYPHNYLYDREYGKKQYILPIQNNIFDKFQKICDYIIFSDLSPDNIKEIFAKKHINALFDIRKRNLIIQKTMIDAHIENFGYFKYTEKTGVIKAPKNIQDIKNLLIRIYRSKEKLLGAVFLIVKYCAQHDLFIINKLNSKIIENNVRKFEY
jgi:FMN phosphatase YigB (HAD superfamily)